MLDPEDEESGYFLDDGTKVDPNLMEKPSLCTTCKKDEVKSEEVLCNLNRIDQDGEKDFKCYSYVSKFDENTNENKEKDEGISF